MTICSQDRDCLKRLTVLYVEDEDDTREQFTRFLKRLVGVLIAAKDGEEGLAAFRAHRPHIVVTDIQMPKMDGLSMAAQIRKLDKTVRLVVLTAFEQVEYLKGSINVGVDKYLTKPIDGVQLQQTLSECAGSIFHLHDASPAAEHARTETDRDEPMVGDSAPMREVYATIGKVAQGDWTVLIEGETGTGKELIAQAIHRASLRRNGPFVAANCAGLSESILGSQLFGHIRGAFTGAVSDREGLFEAAHGGTLFLDEIGDVVPAVQSALLRVLQEKEITRLGEARPRKVDVRIVAATNRNLQQRVKEGHFREDLLYRVRSARVWVPPLRERRQDIPLLVSAFLAEKAVTGGKPVTEVSQEAMRWLLRHAWPGNVRELRGAIEHAVVHCRGNRIEADDLPIEVIEAAQEQPTPPPLPEISERDRIIAVLHRTGGNRARAARILGIGRATLYRRLDELGIRTADVDTRE